MKKIISSALRDCGFSLDFRKDASLYYFGISFAVAFAVCASNAPLWLMAIAGVNAVVSLCCLKSDVNE